ncbi:MAG: PIN domain-containing protein [Thermoplasmata archaeon]
MPSYCLFDSMVHVTAVDRTPEKWQSRWDEVRRNRRTLLLFEPLVAEIVYHLTQRTNRRRAEARILELKQLPAIKMDNLDDDLAYSAAALRLKHEARSISYVDGFILAIARRHNAEVLTTDRGLRDAGRSEGVTMNFLPVEALA